MFVAGSGGSGQDDAYEEPADTAADPSGGGGVLAASGNFLLPGSGANLAGPAVNGAIAPLRSPASVGVSTPAGSVRANLSLGSPTQAGVAASTPVGPLAVQTQLGAPLTGSSPTTLGAQTPVGQATLSTGGLSGPTTVAASTGGLLAPVTGPVVGGPVQAGVTVPPLVSPTGGGLAAPVAGAVAPLTGAVGGVLNPSGQPNAVGSLLKR